MSSSTILIVEDEGMVATDLRQRLTNMGFTVTGVADNGEEAIQLAVKDRPDLVLMDIILNGEMDGITAADNIKRQLGIPVIYLTAISDHETVRRAQATEPWCFILKPFYERELAVNIEIALYKARAEKERARLSHELRMARKEIKTLRELLPICSSCKKIRDEDNSWYTFESFISRHSKTSFTHGLCPDCKERFMSDLKRLTHKN
jgi:DNA-binding NtrC family response regulator